MKLYKLKNSFLFLFLIAYASLLGCARVINQGNGTQQLPNPPTYQCPD